MNPITLEWVEKAEGDFAMAGRELRSRSKPFYDGVCFHAQQCVEKYLKAFLQENDQPVPKIHKLAELLLLIVQINQDFQLLLPDLIMLEDYAVDFRYPGITADKQEAKNAYQTAGRARQFIRRNLVLPPWPPIQKSSI